MAEVGLADASPRKSHLREDAVSQPWLYSLYSLFQFLLTTLCASEAESGPKRSSDGSSLMRLIEQHDALEQDRHAATAGYGMCCATADTSRAAPSKGTACSIEVDGALVAALRYRLHDSKLGVSVEATGRGLRVRDVEGGSEARWLGVRPGDLIVELEFQPLAGSVSEYEFELMAEAISRPITVGVLQAEPLPEEHGRGNRRYDDDDDCGADERKGED